ncbi:MAG: DUF4340 domain-containing protein [Bacteroidetes bacterium]|nr:DUF4340 domain-containing protein [Bacteroidota bacterium]
MKKKYLNIIILVLLSITVLVFFIKKREKPSVNKMFAIENPEEIDKIIISNKTEGKITLEKINKNWKVNRKYDAYYPAIELLLFETLKKVRVKGPVPANARLNVISAMATLSTKVEIYTKGEKINEFYVGQPTNDMSGTYMYKTGSKDPYITHIPGFDGFLSTRFPVIEKEWIDKIIFNYKPEEIKSVLVNYPENTIENFEIIRKNKNGDFDIYASQKAALGNINYPTVKQYFEKFQNIYCEGFALFDKNKRDSLALALPYCQIIITDYKNIKTTLKIYRRKSYPKMHGLYDSKGNQLAYDPVRFNAILNNNDRVLIIQDIVFNTIMLKYSDFLAK